MTTAPARPATGSDAATMRAESVSVDFPTRRGGRRRVVHEVSLELPYGGVTVLLGESGSGKTVFSRTIGGMAPARAKVSGAAYFGELDLLRMSPRRLRAVQGDRIGMVAQDPTSSLDPMRRIGGQIVETLLQHRRAETRAAARARSLELLELVRIRDPRRVADCYPHELSGGMRQRVAIAIATSCDPRLVIADEPSSALDASVGARVVELMNELRHRLGTAILLITHDIGIAARIASDPDDRVAVMLGGRVVEYGRAEEVLLDPLHPYTQALIAAEPSAEVPRGGLAVVPESIRSHRRWSDLVKVTPGHSVAFAEEAS